MANAGLHLPDHGGDETGAWQDGDTFLRFDKEPVLQKPLQH